jgi:hypothetical protein
MARKHMTGNSRPLKRLMILAVLILAAVLIRQYLEPGPITEETDSSGAMTVEQATADGISGVMIEVRGEAIRLLPDDNEGSRHQRFIMETPSGQTILVSHNIDLAKRVPLSTSDRITLYGQYEWNDRGGVVHWTHHDPAGRHQGGWIEHRGQRYE